MDFFDDRKEDFVPIYSSVKPEMAINVPEGASVSPYAVLKGECRVDKNVLVAQRSYIENSTLGPGANAQENCYIINSTYEGNDVTAHGGNVYSLPSRQTSFRRFQLFPKWKRECQGNKLVLDRLSCLIP